MREAVVRELVGHVMMVGFAGTEVTPKLSELIRDRFVRNIVLFRHNLVDAAQLTRLTSDLRALAGPDGDSLIISTDQENGIVRRLPDDLAPLPGAMALGALGDLERIRWVGRETGRLLQKVGVNLDLAPVLDVNSNPENPVIGVRAFHERPRRVSELAISWLKGLQSTGVMGVGKHFPGHGDAALDSHKALPVLHHTRDRLAQVEWIPFQEAIRAGLKFLMTAHVALPGITGDLTPATLSHQILTVMARHELGFEGVMMTDCLEMSAIQDTVGVADGALMALRAGADMLSISHRSDLQEEAIERLVEAVLGGEVSGERLEEAAQRVDKVRADLSLPHPVDERPGPRPMELAEIYRGALTVVDDPKGLIPLSGEPKHIWLAVGEAGPIRAGGLEDRVQDVWDRAIQCVWPKALVRRGSADEWQVVGGGAPPELALIVLRSPNDESLLQLGARWASLGLPLVSVAVREPYVLAKVAHGVRVATYEDTPWMIEALVTMLRDGGAGGALPVSLNADGMG